MPKRIFCVLFLSILLCFSGCKWVPATTPTPAETHLETQSASAEVAPTPAALSLPVTEENTFAQDGTLLFTHTYQNVELVLPEAQVADRVILDLLNRMDVTTATADDILKRAELGYTAGQNWQTYICRNIYTPTRLDGNVLSLLASLTTFQGSAHPEGVYSSVSYDLNAGNVLQLHNILLPHFDMTQLTDAIKEVLSAQEEENYLYSYYPQVVDDRFAGDVLDDENWYFSQTGLCFYFAPYEIAPYATGVVVAEVPYEKLTGILEDAYFPEELPATQGSFHAEPFDSAKLDAYNRFWEISLEKGSQKILLHPDTTLCNVRLEVGSNEGEFTPEYTLFSASALSSKDAIVITYDNVTSLSKLRISYSSNNETVSQSIS